MKGFDGKEYAPDRPRVVNIHKEPSAVDLPNYVSIMRGSPYGNRFEIGIDGTREVCITKFKHQQLPFMNVEPLRGKVLGCCCHPEMCHGDLILDKLYGTKAEKVTGMKRIRRSVTYRKY